MNKRTKSFQPKKIDFKFVEDQKIGIVGGIANQAGILDYDNDFTKSGAFDKTVSEKPIVLALWNHNFNEPIGVSKLSTTPDGSLYNEMELDLNVQKARELYSLAKSMHKAGRPLEFSIGFSVKKQSEGTLDGKTIQYLEEIEILETSLVGMGANPGSRATDIKKLQQSNNKKELELAKAKLQLKIKI